MKYPYHSVSACALSLALFSASTAATESQPIIRVEEDWELIVGAPDANSTTPQVTCVISPTQADDGLHAAFELNHRSQPDFISGGLQLQVWNDEVLLGSNSPTPTAVLSGAGEVVRWTQAMEVVAGGLRFEITNGSSATWGNFGGDLQASIATDIANFDAYAPTTSAEHSGIGYGEEQVVKLSLKRVRLTFQDGSVVEDATERIVHSSD